MFVYSEVVSTCLEFLSGARVIFCDPHVFFLSRYGFFSECVYRGQNPIFKD